MRALRRIVLAATLLLGGCARPDGAMGDQREVLVFAAASLREALTEAGAAFTAETGTRVAFNYAGSNDLAHQIRAAPRADVFVSASVRWMDEVEKAGHVVAGSRHELLTNALVVVAHASSPWTAAEPCALAALPFEHAAMGDPDAVPAGTYAREWMRATDCGGRSLWDAVKDRVAPAPDVRAALGLVLSDPGVIGLVYRTDRMAFADRLKVVHEVRGGPPIRFVLARISGGAAPAEGSAFARFLAGPRAGEIFTRHGFTPVAAPPR